MNQFKAKPVAIDIVRRTRTFTYELADFKDWALLFDNTVLEVKSRDGTSHYWPVDSVTYWRVRPKVSKGEDMHG